MRSFTHLCVLAAIIFSSGVASAATVRMKLAWILNDQYAGQIYAHHKGWYRKEGIDLVLMPHQSGFPDPYDSIIKG